jgi:predicted nucleic acid-binding protein
MIFLDSSFLVAFEVDGDANHTNAVRVMGQVAEGEHGRPTISDYVFDEVVTVTFVRTKNLSKSRRVGEGMLESFRLLKVDDEVFSDSWRLFRSQKQARFSFTDATTIELMRRHGIETIATFDGAFRGLEFGVVGP